MSVNVYKMASKGLVKKLSRKYNNKRSTIKDVARVAGVSIATVSRILNGHGGVSTQLKQKVQAAVKELDYQPNGMARALKNQESRSIGLIIPDIENPFFPALVRGVEDAAQQNGYALILCNTDGKPKVEEKYLKFLLTKQVDGILFVGNLGNDGGQFWFSGLNVPVVLLDRRIAGTPFSAVLTDNRAGAVMAVEYLIRQGRRKIVMIGGRQKSITSLERAAGFLAAMRAHDYSVSEHDIYYGDFTFEGGYRAVQALLENKTAFDAVFAANDMMAIGVMEGLSRHGLRVPDDVAVVGFDNIHMSAWYKPALTTVSQPVYQMGKIGVEILVDEIVGNGDSRQEIVLTPKLVIRRSCGGREE